MEDNPSFKYRRAMIIDDSSIDRFLVKAMVKKTHFAEHMHDVDSGEAALSYLSACAIADLPQIIFLDINMPGMTGFEFLDKYEGLSNDVKQSCTIYMLSSSLHASDHDKASNNMYVKGFISKPLSAASLEGL